jgi:hypothetical protein
MFGNGHTPMWARMRLVWIQKSLLHAQKLQRGGMLMFKMSSNGLSMASQWYPLIFLNDLAILDLPTPHNQISNPIVFAF